jgi:FKBP-type peptidyl-prolyl cis-trans isomerase
VRRRVLLSVLALLLAAGCASHAGGTPAGKPSASATPNASLDSVKVTTAGNNGAPKLSFPTPFSVTSTTTKVLKPGSGATIPEDSTVLLDYVGVNGNTGQQFDSSWDRGSPQTFPLVRGQMIPGFIDGLVGAKVGSELLIAMPPSAGYGASGNPQAGISGTDTLLFVVHPIAVSDPHPLPTAKGKPVPLPRSLPALQTNASGVPTGFKVTGKQAPQPPTKLGVYPVIKGSGPVVKKGDLLTVNYLGQLYPDGKVFDQSFSGGKPVTFQVGTGSLIKGWDQGLVGQRVGSRVVLVLPPSLAYGAHGSPPAIPGNAPLIFAVDLLGVGRH